MKRIKIAIYLFFIILGISIAWDIVASTVNIDSNIEYQTIDGLGGSEAGLFPQTDNDFDLLFTELGTSILRTNLRHYVEDTTSDNPDNQGDSKYNDNNDPYVIDWNGVDTHWIDYLADLLLIKAQQRGINQFSWNISTPPSWMKEGGTRYYSGGHLLPQYYQEFAEYLIIWYKGLQERKGITLNYISLGNEPDGGHNPDWDGCSYTGEELRDLIKVVGPRLEAEGISAKILLPETVALSRLAEYARPTLEDPIARQYLDILITHEYWLNEPDAGINYWKNASNLASQYNLKLWMSEHNDGNVGWDGGYRFAQFIHNALYYGNVSAWLFHELYEPTSWGGGLGGLITENGPWPRFYWLKNYFKYIRPGAVRIKAESGDSNILVTSFIHKQNNTFTTVIINRHDSDQTVNFNINNIQGLSILNVIRTSATENSVNLEQVSATGNSFTYTLPKKSVTTFTGTIGVECLSDQDCRELSCPGGGFVHERCINNKCVLETECRQVPTISISTNSAQQGERVSFQGVAPDPSKTVVGYSWLSSIDGQLSDQKEFSASYLSQGTHTISFRAQYDNGTWSDPVNQTLTIGPSGAGLQGGTDTGDETGVSSTEFIRIDNPLKFDKIEDIIYAITGLLKTIGLGIGLIMVIIGGIQIMTAAGSEERATKGKKTIMWAVIGYAVVFLVDFIVGFVKEILGG